MRALLCLLPLTALCASDQTDAQQVLASMSKAYTDLKAIHLVVMQTNRVSLGGRSGVTVSELDLAIKGATLYRVRAHDEQRDALALSDGETTWKALPKKKQWTQVTAASVSDSSEEDAQAPKSKDLRTAVRDELITRFLMLARKAESPTLVKEENYKLDGEKIPCYLIRARTGQVKHELWIDKQRYFVLQYRVTEKKDLGRGEAEIEDLLKLKRIEVNGEVSASLFRFEPDKSWSEVEMLVLPGEERMMLTGERASSFALKSTAGESFELASLRGKVVVLDFWATWCGPCRAEMPSVEKLRAEFGEKVQFLGVNDEEPGPVKTYIKDHKLQMATLLDSKRDVHRQYGIRAIPTMFVIDKEGVIRSHFIGSRSEGQLKKAIQSVMETK